MELGVEPTPDLRQLFREDPSFADYGDEVVVGYPARQHVQMDVSADSCSGSFAASVFFVMSMYLCDGFN